MKIKFKKPNMSKAVEVIEEEAEFVSELDADEVFSAVDRVNAMFEALKEILIDRSEELNALKHCLLCKQHMLLIGEAGGAKSMLGNLAFGQITGARTFRKQFHNGTQVDEVFGPMDSRLYKEKAIWKHNIQGMLPDCHFANLDELFRASNVVLPSMMEILNEREYRHGSAHIKVPLLTAIGTTNFSSDAEELKAFLDRWLVVISTKPMKSSNSRSKAIRGHYERQRNPASLSSLPTVSLADIQLLQQATAEVEVDKKAFDLYEEMVGRFCKAADIVVSDRRLCQAFSLAQAAHVLEMTEPVFEPLHLKHLNSVSMGLFKAGDENAAMQFQSTYDRIVKSHIKDSESLRRHRAVEAQLKKMQQRVDTKMKPKDALEAYRRCMAVVSGFAAMDASEVNSDENRELVDRLTVQAQSMARTLEDLIPESLLESEERLPAVEEEAQDLPDEAQSEIDVSLGKLKVTEDDTIENDERI